VCLADLQKDLHLFVFQNSEDLQCFHSNKKPKILEPPQPAEILDDSPMDDDSPKVLNDCVGLAPEFVSISVGTKGAYFQTIGDDSQSVSLNLIFPQAQNRKRQRNVEKRAKRKETKRMKKHNLEEVSNSNENSKTSSDEVQSTSILQNPSKISSYIESCSRTVIGRVVRGDYSFIRARGVSFGYIPLCSLPFVIAIPNRILLVRNTSSKLYHPARTSVHLSSCEL